MSTETKHTPGPWMIFPGGDIGSASVRRLDTVVIRGGTVKGQNIGEAMANARLITAGPEMLEVLKAFVQAESELFASDPFVKTAQPGHPIQEAWLRARNVIAKATGA